MALDAAAAQSRPSSFIFPVLLEPCDLPKDLRQRQAVDISGRKGLNTLLAALRGLAARTAGVAVPGDSSFELDWEEPRVGGRLRDIIRSTREYESWLRKLTLVVEEHFRLKHQAMSQSPLAFMRAAFYRWVEVWPRECSDLAEAPLTLSAGEVNVQSFGTWLDPEGRLGWGLTSFDEAYPFPYTSDLVRLATSLFILGKSEVLVSKVHLSRLCGVMAAAYSDTLTGGGSPYVLGARHAWLYDMIRPNEKYPKHFWDTVRRLPKAEDVPIEAREALERSLPIDARFEVLKRIAGLGSLGRPRYLGLAEWMGGPLAAEARYIPVPAGAWAAGHTSNVRTYHNVVLETARHTPNLRSGVWKGLYVRRIGPEITSVDLLQKKDITKLMRACAREVANVHLGSPGTAPRIVKHLGGLQASVDGATAKARLR